MKKSIYSFFPVLLLVILGCVIYSNTLNSSFQFDDGIYIVDNPDIRSFTAMKDVWGVPGHAARYITFLTFALNYKIHGLDVFGYHIVNIAIHLMNTFLVWWFIFLICSSPSIKSQKIAKYKHHIAYFSALIFLVHPLQTQAVTYLCQRFASLATFFYLASVCFYMKARIVKHSRILYVGSFVAALLGMFTKEIVFTLPIMIILLELYFLRDPEAKAKEEPSKFSKWLLAVPLLSVLIIPAFYSFEIKNILFSLRRSGSHMGDYLSAGNYLLTQFRVILTYIKLLVLPFGQNLLYDFPASKSFFEVSTALSFLILLCIVVIGVHLFKKNRLLSFAIFWFFTTMLVESSIIPIQHVIFEHRVYLPMVGFALLVCVGCIELIKEPKKYIALFSIIIIIFSVLTFQRNKVWETPISLWQDVIAKAPERPRAYLNLGNAYAERGETDKAIVSFTQAIKLVPNYGMAYSNRGLMFKNIGQYERALDDLNKALEINDRFAKSYTNRGNLFSALNKFQLAEEDFDRSIELDPKNAKAFLNRGAMYNKQGKYDLAFKDFSEAIRLDPTMSEAHNNLGIVYSHRGENILAQTHFTRAIQIRPDYEEAFVNRGIYYESMKQYQLAHKDYNKAIFLNPNRPLVYFKRAGIYVKSKQYNFALADYNKVLQLNPNHAQAYNERAKLFGMGRQYKEALSDLNNALRLSPKYIEAYNNRGVVYKSMGQLDLAMNDFNKAIDINPSYLMAYNNRGTIHNELNQNEEAIKDYSMAIELNKDFLEAYYNRGVSKFNVGLYDSAIEDYNQVLKLNPNFIRANMKRGNVYFAQKKYTEALKDYDLVLKVNPQNRLAYFNRSLIYRESKKFDQALKDALQAKKLGQGDMDGYIEELQELSKM